MQGTLYTLAQNCNSIVATDAQRTGNFSSTPGVTIRNPLTGAIANDGRGPNTFTPVPQAVPCCNTCRMRMS
jgi:hypothetical protein